MCHGNGFDGWEGLWNKCAAIIDNTLIGCLLLTKLACKDNWAIRYKKVPVMNKNDSVSFLLNEVVLHQIKFKKLCVWLKSFDSFHWTIEQTGRYRNLKRFRASEDITSGHDLKFLDCGYQRNGPLANAILSYRYLHFGLKRNPRNCFTIPVEDREWNFQHQS